jgi:hypothetical protein
MFRFEKLDVWKKTVELAPESSLRRLRFSEPQNCNNRDGQRFRHTYVEFIFRIVSRPLTRVPGPSHA